MKQETLILLFPISHFDRKEAEGIENNAYTSDNFNEALSIWDEKEANIEAHSLTDFMDLCNNQDVNLEDYWVTYVKLY